MRRQQTLFDIEPIGPPGRYRREDNVATRHAPSLPTHITTLDGHDLVKQWAAWSTAAADVAGRGGGGASRSAETARVRPRGVPPGGSPGQQNDQAVRKFAVGAAGDAAAAWTPLRCSVAWPRWRRVMAALELALARGRHEGVAAAAPSAARRLGARGCGAAGGSGAGAGAGGRPPTPPPPPPPPLEKIVDAFAKKQATWREP